jgi:hypothetical protein
MSRGHDCGNEGVTKRDEGPPRSDGGLEANPEEVKSLVEHQEVPEEEAAVEIFGTVEDRHEDRHLPSTAEETDPGRWWVPE